MKTLLWIGCGGAAGALFRYTLAGWCQRLSGGVFPVGTLAVNVLGCLLIGFVGAFLAGPLLVREEHRLGLLVGLLGGFTTFSTFGWETFALLNERAARHQLPPPPPPKPPPLKPPPPKPLLPLPRLRGVDVMVLPVVRRQLPRSSTKARVWKRPS